MHAYPGTLAGEEKVVRRLRETLLNSSPSGEVENKWSQELGNLIHAHVGKNDTHYSWTTAIIRHINKDQGQFLLPSPLAITVNQASVISHQLLSQGAFLLPLLLPHSQSVLIRSHHFFLYLSCALNLGYYSN